MKKVMMLTAVLMMAGCAAQTYQINRGGMPAPTANETQNFYLGGISQEQELDAAAICGGANKVAKVVSRQELDDWFLGAITFGLYTPRHANVYCSR